VDERVIYFRLRNPLYETCRRGTCDKCTEFIILRGGKFVFFMCVVCFMTLSAHQIELNDRMVGE
jgi:hypothetical protein